MLIKFRAKLSCVQQIYGLLYGGLHAGRTQVHLISMVLKRWLGHASAEEVLLHVRIFKFWSARYDGQPGRQLSVFHVYKHRKDDGAEHVVAAIASLDSGGYGRTRTHAQSRSS